MTIPTPPENFFRFERLLVGLARSGVDFAVGSSPLSYQWLKNGSIISNATGASLTLNAVRRVDAGSYSVQVITVVVFETSSAARLSVSVRCALRGSVWNDANTNGVWDRFLSTLNPDVVFVMDKSTSTLDPFGGSPVGDYNHDGSINSILDAELAALEVMNNALIRRGLVQSARISLVEFANSASVPDMEPGTSGPQAFTTPDTDSDANGVPDVIDVLKKLRAQSGNNFREGLRIASGCYHIRQIAPEGYYEVVPCALGDHEVCVPTSGGDTTLSLGDKAKNRFTFPKIQGDFFEFTYGADVGISWRVDRSTDLVRWSEITNIVGGDYSVTIRDLRHPADPHVFCRNIRE